MTSADYKTETLCKGLKIGASAFYLKPIKAQDVVNMWQFSDLRKNRERDACRRTTQAIPKSICTTSSTDEDKRRGNLPILNYLFTHFFLYNKNNNDDALMFTQRGKLRMLFGTQTSTLALWKLCLFWVQRVGYYSSP